MAQMTTITLIDDLDNEVAADETVRFSLDGVQYEIDLSANNAQALREEIGAWIDHARRADGQRAKRGRSISPAPRRRKAAAHAPIDRMQSAAIREWARSKGMKVSTRGRISAEIVAAYNDAH
jgi:hypothetical protein